MTAIQPVQAVIFSAPQGWGKGLKAPQLLKEFGCSHVAHHEWEPDLPVTPGALHLTNVAPSEFRNNKSGLYRLVARGWKS